MDWHYLTITTPVNFVWYYCAYLFDVLKFAVISGCLQLDIVELIVTVSV